MPMTTQQETWLEDQEKERTKFSIEYAKKLVADQLAKALKKKEIDKPKKDDQSKGKFFSIKSDALLYFGFIGFFEISNASFANFAVFFIISFPFPFD